jgi:hypothetical protein
MIAHAAAAQPLIRSGARYTVEVARCILFGVLASAACAAGFFLLAGDDAARHRSLVVVLSALVFPALYALVGHHRGVGRSLASLARSHGGYLFDHTLGRFVEALEARRPGAFAGVAASPRKLLPAFRLYLHERPAMPRQIRRVALRYVDGVGRHVDAAALAAGNVIADGRVNPAALRHVVVDRMQGRFMPRWTTFGAVLAVQLAVTGALAWASH